MRYIRLMKLYAKAYVRLFEKGFAMDWVDLECAIIASSAVALIWSVLAMAVLLTI